MEYLPFSELRSIVQSKRWEQLIFLHPMMIEGVPPDGVKEYVQAHHKSLLEWTRRFSYVKALSKVNAVVARCPKDRYTWEDLPSHGVRINSASHSDRDIWRFFQQWGLTQDENHPFAIKKLEDLAGYVVNLRVLGSRLRVSFQDGRNKLIGLHFNEGGPPSAFPCFQNTPYSRLPLHDVKITGAYEVKGTAIWSRLWVFETPEGDIRLPWQVNPEHFKGKHLFQALDLLNYQEDAILQGGDEE